MGVQPLIITARVFSVTSAKGDEIVVAEWPRVSTLPKRPRPSSTKDAACEKRHATMAASRTKQRDAEAKDGGHLLLLLKGVGGRKKESHNTSKKKNADSLNF